ncbi:Origin recognition complex subunit 4 [Carabus blaptoides fortunei]
MSKHEYSVFNNYEKERQQVYNLIKLSVTTGESNSALIIGARSTGKTVMLRDVLKELQTTINLNSNAIVVELNGLIHTDDKLALKSCTIQMNLENAVHDKVFGTFAENLTFLLECLRGGQRETSKCLIFVLEEFDLFCNHTNQTLLYNLLDMTHYSEIPICVIGLTSRLDVIELFEKRVKSRFSHRQIYLFPDEANKTGSFESRLDRVQSLLSINSATPEIIAASFKTSWNEHVADLVKDDEFVKTMRRLYDLTKCERVLKNLLIIFVSQLNVNCDKLKANVFIDLVKNYTRDNKIHVLNSLSVLEICLIIAMKHHSDIYDNQPFNFEMILERYTKFVNANAMSQNVQRSVVFKAFEHIKNLELVAPVSISSGPRQKEYELYNMLLLPEQIDAAFKAQTGTIPTEVGQWLNTRPT